MTKIVSRPAKLNPMDLSPGFRAVSATGCMYPYSVHSTVCRSLRQLSGAEIKHQDVGATGQPRTFEVAGTCLSISKVVRSTTFSSIRTSDAHTSKFLPDPPGEFSFRGFASGSAGRGRVDLHKELEVRGKARPISPCP